MVASEMHPFATSGGLSEVLGALPQALTRLGHRVTVIVPRYRRVAIGPNISTVSPTPHRAEPAADAEAAIDMGQRQFKVGFHVTEIGERLSAVFVDVPELFDRDGLYGNGDGDYPDNAIRFAVFSRAALEYLRLRGRRPSVIHAHDWQTGLVPAYQKMLFSPDPVDRRRAGGVHDSQPRVPGHLPGRDARRDRPRPRDVLHVEAMEFYGRISYLKAGINFSERITTVSPTYAREILERQNRLRFRRRSRAPRGRPAWASSTASTTTAGIRPPTRSCRRATAPTISPARREVEARSCSRRQVCDATPAALERPLIGLVSRLTDQKGFDLIAAAAEELMTLDAAWVMLGSGDRRLRGAVEDARGAFPGSRERDDRLRRAARAPHRRRAPTCS